MGPSGSGKTTLMNMIGCLDRPTSGEIRLDGEDVSRLNEDRLAEIRGEKIGFVFQNFNLIPRMTALKNVVLPMVFLGIPRSTRNERAIALLRDLGLENRISHFPSELSAGEQQRVAIARALANNPSIILADEPTGNLDTKTGEQVMDILTSLNKEGKTIVLVTHDPSIARYSKRVLPMKDGRIGEVHD
jgi:putative ABC transport system ATP-binding protein